MKRKKKEKIEYARKMQKNSKTYRCNDIFIIKYKKCNINITNGGKKMNEKKENLPFAYAEIIRLMKEELDDDKIIREQVKIEMNKFLGEILKNICKQLNKYPYTSVEYEMFKECIYPYTNIERINDERKRIIQHLDTIKMDCDVLSEDVKKTLRINEKDEGD